MIRINDDYVIEVDELNYTLKQDMHKKDKEGNHVYKTYGYYNNLESAFKGAIEVQTKKSLANTEISLYDAVTCVRNIHKEFTDTFRRVIRESEG